VGVACQGLVCGPPGGHEDPLTLQWLSMLVSLSPGHSGLLATPFTVLRPGETGSDIGPFVLWAGSPVTGRAVLCLSVPLDALAPHKDTHVPQGAAFGRSQLSASDGALLSVLGPRGPDTAAISHAAPVQADGLQEAVLAG
jgi:hypothetical protein